MKPAFYITDSVCCGSNAPGMKKLTKFEGMKTKFDIANPDTSADSRAKLKLILEPTELKEETEAAVA